MTSNERNVILEGAEKAFFEAMLAGYASGGKVNDPRVTKKVTADNYKQIVYDDDGVFIVVDRYCVVPHTDFSAGTTTVFLNGSPVWWMAYGGFYPKDVIPILKGALVTTYKQKVFVGGRGPVTYFDPIGIFLYKNSVEQPDFTEFKGHEAIFRVGDGGLVGYHTYFGLSLI